MTTSAASCCASSGLTCWWRWAPPLINLSMLFIAASVFSRSGSPQVESLQAAHAGIGQLVGGGAALAFAVALLASGLSSSSVGTYAGQVVMQGFIGRRIPLFVRRGITMLPALLVLALGLPVTTSLVISQVVLSFGIPFALVPLVLLTRREDIMGALVNRPHHHGGGRRHRGAHHHAERLSALCHPVRVTPGAGAARPGSDDG